MKRPIKRWFHIIMKYVFGTYALHKVRSRDMLFVFAFLQYPKSKQGCNHRLKQSVCYKNKNELDLVIVWWDLHAVGWSESPCTLLNALLAARLEVAGHWINEMLVRYLTIRAEIVGLCFPPFCLYIRYSLSAAALFITRLSTAKVFPIYSSQGNYLQLDKVD